MLINTKAILKIFLLLLPLLLQSCVQKETDCILFCAGESKIEFAYSAQSFNEAAGTVSITVSISPAPLNPISVDYEINTNASTASLTSDYNLTTGTLNFAAGQTSANISLTLINDSIAAEGTEYITLRLLNPSSGSLGAKSSTVISVIDNDLSDLTVAEGASIDSAHIDCNDGSGATQFISLLSAGDADANCSLQVTPYFIRCAPTYKSGHSDWSTNVSASCTINGVVNPINIAVNVTNTNRAPTHSGMTPIILATGAKASTATTITYADLLANINGLTDADGDTNFIFRIQSLDNGTMTKNGAGIATGITTIATGESVVWTPNSSAFGAVAAFKVSVGDGLGGFSSTTQVTIDQVMRFPTLSSISATEQAPLTSAAYTCSNGGSGTPVISIQTYGATLNSSECSINGANQLVCPSVPNHASATGNWSETLTIRCTIGDPMFGGMIIDRSQVVNVTNYNRAPVDFPAVTDYQGNLNTNFNITFTDLKTKTETAHGSAVLDPDGDAIRFKIISIGSGVTVRRGATVQAVGSILSATQTWTITPPTNSVGRLPIVELKMIDSNNLESSASEIVRAQVKGFVPLSNITVSEGQSTGNIALSCYNGETGIITYALGSQSDADSNCSVIGSNLECSPNYKSAQANWTSNLVINCLDNAVLYTSINTHPTPQLTVNVTNVNRLPTLSAADFTGATWDTPFQFTHADLLTETAAVDLDSDTISFRIKSIATYGTLSRGGTPLAVGNTIVPSDVIRWLPNTTTIGTDVVMFTIAAFDGTDESTTIVNVTNDVYGVAPITNISATIGQTYESAELLCADSSSQHNNFTLLTILPAEAGCSIQDNGSNPFIRCLPMAPAVSATTVTVQCDVTGATRNFTFQSATLQQPPSYTGAVARIDGALRNTNFLVTYAMLSAATSGVVSDPNGDTIRYRIDFVHPGAGTISVATGTYINVGQSFTWTPPSNTLGEVIALQISACDALGCSSSAPDFTFGIAGFDPISNLTTSEAANIESAALNCQSGAYPTPTSLTILTQSDADANCSIAAGKVSCTPNYKATTSPWTSTITVRCMLNLTPYNQEFTLTVNHTNQAPTMTTISAIGAIDDGNSVFITYDDFKAKTDLTDIDPDTHDFIFDSIQITPGEGNLFIDGAPISNGSRLREGQTLEIRPVAMGSIVTNPTPKLLARFTATDGIETTNPPIDLNLVFVRFEAISDVSAGLEGVMVSTAPLDCSDGLGNTPSYSIIAQSNSNANCVMNDNVVDCTPNDTSNNTDPWDATIEVECSIGSATISKTFELTDVQNVNNAPSFTGLGTLYSGVINQAKEISYSDIAAVAIMSDTENEDLCFRAVTPVGFFSDSNFSTPVINNELLCNGESWYYMPTGAAGSDDILSLRISDGTSNSQDTRILKLNQINMGFNDPSENLITMKENTTQNSLTYTCQDGGDLSQLGITISNQTDDDLNCIINHPGAPSPSFDIECTPNYKTTNNDWSGSVTVRCVFSPTYAVEQVFDVDVQDTNRAPTAAYTVLAGAVTLSPFIIKFEELMENSDDEDEGSTNLKYCIESHTANGTLSVKGGAPNVYTACGSAGDEILPGDQVTWTPTLGVHGDVDILHFKVIDSASPNERSTSVLLAANTSRAPALIAINATSPVNLDAGDIPINTLSADLSITIINDGDHNADAFQVKTPPGFILDITSSTCDDFSSLTANSTCNYVFKALPSKVHNAKYNGVATLLYNDYFDPQIITLGTLSANGVTNNKSNGSQELKGTLTISTNDKTISADVNGDGLDDIITLSIPDKKAVVKYNDWDGINPSFWTTEPMSTIDLSTITPLDIIAADFNGDGLIDIAISATNSKVYVYQNTGSAPYVVSNIKTINLPDGVMLNSLTPGNLLNENDLPDIAGLDLISKIIYIIKNDSILTNISFNNTYPLNVSAEYKEKTLLSIADINNDGFNDIVNASSDTTTNVNIKIFEQNKISRNFTETYAIDMLDDNLRALEVKDIIGRDINDNPINQDGYKDLIVLTNKNADSFVTLIRNNLGEAIQFEYAPPDSISTYRVEFLTKQLFDLVTGDFNGDGNLDFSVLNNSDLLFEIFRNDYHIESFGRIATLPTGATPRSMHVMKHADATDTLDIMLINNGGVNVYFFTGEAAP